MARYRKLSHCGRAARISSLRHLPITSTDLPAHLPHGLGNKPPRGKLEPKVRQNRCFQKLPFQN
jgi:hypothetical protein